MEGHVIHTTRIVTASAALVLGVAASPAMADDGKVIPGSACQASFFQGLQPLFRSNGEILSAGSDKVQVHCPVVKDLAKIKRAEIMLIDRNPAADADISCTLFTLRKDGTTQQSQTQKSNSSFTVALPINFGAQSTAAGGSYSLVCELPPFNATFGPSAIVGYTVVED
jgi:hypothetical protein